MFLVLLAAVAAYSASVPTEPVAAVGSWRFVSAVDLSAGVLASKTEYTKLC